ncbi:MAG TPA: hydrogenase maturation protease [Polyangia bacterium]|nr:hydrogenase maturation protease [Polyangia bacterium]
MTGSAARILVYGYGNPGRLDDGLGPAVAEELAALGLPGITVDSNYQLSVEDAAAVAAHDVAIFVDADTAGPEPFWFDRLEPRRETSFSTHSVSPQAVLALAADLLGSRAEGYLLGIRGYEFNEFGEGLSAGARDNLGAAVGFLRQALVDRRFAEYAAAYRPGSDVSRCARDLRHQEGAP